MRAKQHLFLSHSWCGDGKPHDRVVAIACALRDRGWRVWIDDTNLVGNVDACIACGIENARAVVLFLNREYCRKVNDAACAVGRCDNCYNEFHYAIWSRKLLIPVVIDPSMRDPSSWSPGVVPMHLACEKYVDGCCDDLEVAHRLDKHLKKINLRPDASSSTSTFAACNRWRRHFVRRPTSSTTIYI